MPPKRARTSNVESSEASAPSSSSSRGTASRPRFTDQIATKEYSRLLTKPIFKERGFLPSAQNGRLLNMIVDKGWTVFCEAPEAVL